MKCLSCGKEFIIKRSFSSLLSTKRYYVCEECYHQMPFSIEYNYLPLNGYMLEIISLFKEKTNADYAGFIDEYSQIYFRVLKMNKVPFILLYDIFQINDHLLSEIEQISMLLATNIIVLTNVYLM